jgi:hypothetical protein
MSITSNQPEKELTISLQMSDKYCEKNNSKKKYNCEHNRIKSQCKECGGSSICEHKRRKSTCKECGGSSICKHKKQKSQCKECGGSSICEHNIIKSICKECGGSSICKHEKQKSQCKECGGSSFCEHGKYKSRCRKCGGVSFCEHNRIKSQCKECGGSSFCEHNRIKSVCKECGGGSICEHNRKKTVCKDCGGSSICEHDKHKAKCKKCGGSSICKHEKQKPQCKECGGSSLCKSTWCETRGNVKYKGYCLFCFIHIFPEIEISRNYKTKEKDVVDRIKQSFPDFTWIADKRIIDGCSFRRPDLLLDLGSHILIVEIDENKHTDYDCSCENKRLMELSRDVHHRPIIFIRFNPDSYTDKDGVLVKSCWKLNKLSVMQIRKEKLKEWEERIESLKNEILYWIDNPSEKTIEIIELFY